eukprot:4706669-Pyramimonas_sp.AAC.1
MGALKGAWEKEFNLEDINKGKDDEETEMVDQLRYFLEESANVIVGIAARRASVEMNPPPGLQDQRQMEVGDNYEVATTEYTVAKTTRRQEGQRADVWDRNNNELWDSWDEAWGDSASGSRWNSSTQGWREGEGTKRHGSSSRKQSQDQPLGGYAMRRAGRLNISPPCVIR